MGAPLRMHTAWSGLESIAPLAPTEASDRVEGRAPQFVLEPVNESQVSALLRWSDDRDLCVAPRGGGSKLAWGSGLHSLDLMLSLRAMNRVVEHAWDDLTVTVEPGCTIAELQRTLAEHGQRLAIDPLFPERATIGGVLAANDSGSLRARFGSLRDLIIGVTLALPDGTLARSGGKVVKNVAGYDLPKLATGSFGTLGVITQAIFRLHPLPAAERTLSFEFETPAAANAAALALMDSVLTFSGLQLRCTGGPLCRLDVRFEGIASAVEEQAQRASHLVVALVEFSGETVADAGSQPWRAGEELFRTKPSGVASWCVLKVSTLPSEIAALLENLRSLAEPSGALTDAVVQSVGVGFVRLEGAEEDVVEIVAGLRGALAPGQGSVVLLECSDGLRRRVDVWGKVGSALELMRAVKRQLDPKGTLNPGRFVGGI